MFGAGKMGTGIALQFAVTGFPVKLLAFDVREQQTSAGVIEDNLKLLAENGLVDADRCDEIRKRIDIVLDFDEAAREADFAIECVLENMELKQNYFCAPGSGVQAWGGAVHQHICHERHGDRLQVRPQRADFGHSLLEPALPHPIGRGGAYSRCVRPCGGCGV